MEVRINRVRINRSRPVFKKNKTKNTITYLLKYCTSQAVSNFSKYVFQLLKYSRKDKTLTRNYRKKTHNGNQILKHYNTLLHSCSLFNQKSAYNWLELKIQRVYIFNLVSIIRNTFLKKLSVWLNIFGCGNY